MGVKCVKWCRNNSTHETCVKLVDVAGQPCVGSASWS